MSCEVTINYFAFMEAADDGKRQGGKLVTIKNVLDRAKAEVSAQQ